MAVLTDKQAEAIAAAIEAVAEEEAEKAIAYKFNESRCSIGPNLAERALQKMIEALTSDE